MPISGSWYVTMKAVEDYLRLTGRDPDPDDDTWDSAEEELTALTKEAHYVKTLASGAEMWRGKRPLRLTFHVMIAPRPEGDAPQLVTVLGESARTTRSTTSRQSRLVSVWDGANTLELQVMEQILDPGPDRLIAYHLANGRWLSGYRGRSRPDHVERLRETVNPPEWVVRQKGNSARRGRD